MWMLKLTSPDKTPLWLNARYIEAIVPDPPGALIYVTGVSRYKVTETTERILRLIPEPEDV